jgi:hypothetical protein
LRKIITGDEWCSEDRPQAKVRAILRGRHAAIANFEHDSRVLHAGLDHSVRHLTDHLFIYAAPELIPTVPTHQWGECEAFIDSGNVLCKGNVNEHKKK